MRNLRFLRDPGRASPQRSTSRSTPTAAAGGTASSSSTSRTSQQCPSIVYGILGLAYLVRGPLDLGRTRPRRRTDARAARPSRRGDFFARSDCALCPARSAKARWASAPPAGRRSGTRSFPQPSPESRPASILALSRAIGETAPLIMVGAATYIAFNPTGLDSPFTALPLQIFNWLSSPQDEFKVLAASAIIVLLVMLLVINSVAIIIRNRYEKQVVTGQADRHDRLGATTQGRKRLSRSHRPMTGTQAQWTLTQTSRHKSTKPSIADAALNPDAVQRRSPRRSSSSKTSRSATAATLAVKDVNF